VSGRGSASSRDRCALRKAASTCATALRDYVAMLDKEREAVGTAYPNHGKLMCYEDGRRMHPDTVTRRFNRLMDLAGVRHIRLHDIRHTYVTLACDHGVDSKVLSDRVGHASEAVTQQVYTHRSVGHGREAAKMMGELIKGALNKAGQRPVLQILLQNAPSDDL
jgi:integrase